MFGWISLLLACEAPPAPAPRAPAPAPVPVAAPVPPPAPPEPDQNEFCGADGWCWPYVTFADASAAATDGALALGKAGGPAILWADGRWVGGIDRIRGEVEALTRDGDALLVDVCRKEGCERIRWTPAGADPPIPVARPRPVDPRRLGDWRVRYSTLIRADGLKLSPWHCATWFGILGDARDPFVECGEYSHSTVFRVDGGRPVPMTELWGTDWMTRTSQVVQWGAGCAPCITTEKRFVLRDGDGRWRLIPQPDADWFVEPTRLPTDPEWWLPHLAPHQLAWDGQHLFVSFAGAVHRWDGEWREAAPPTAWASVLPLQKFGETAQYATPDGLLDVNHQVHDLRRQRWEHLLPPATAPSGFVDVIGVASDDALQVRLGPHPIAPAVGALPPDARCVESLGIEGPPGMRSWRALKLPTGERGWANGRFLRPSPPGQC